MLVFCYHIPVCDYLSVTLKELALFGGAQEGSGKRLINEFFITRTTEIEDGFVVKFYPQQLPPPRFYQRTEISVGGYDEIQVAEGIGENGFSRGQDIGGTRAVIGYQTAGRQVPLRDAEKVL